MHEQGLVRFVEPGYRARLRGFLADERHRRSLSKEIPNAFRLDHRFATQVDGIEDAERRLRAHGAPSSCHVV